jgi:hypothetical protein
MGQVQWLMPIIPAVWEVEMEESWFEAAQAKVRETTSQKQVQGGTGLWP